MGGNHKIAVTDVYLLTSGEYNVVKRYNREALGRLDMQIKALKLKGWEVIVMGDFNGHVGQVISGNSDKTDSIGNNNHVDFMSVYLFNSKNAFTVAHIIILKNTCAKKHTSFKCDKSYIVD